MKEYILPFPDLVVNPGLTVPVHIDNPLSVACVETAANKGQRLVLTAQRGWSYPITPNDIYNVGTIGEIAQVLRMPDGALDIIVRTTDAVHISNALVFRGPDDDVIDRNEFAEDILMT